MLSEPPTTSLDHVTMCFGVVKPDERKFAGKMPKSYLLVGVCYGVCAWAVVGAPVPGLGDGWGEITVFGTSWNFSSCLVMGLLRFERRFLKGVLKVQREQLVGRIVDLKAERASQMDGAEQIKAPDCSYHRSSFWLRVNVSSPAQIPWRNEQTTSREPTNADSQRRFYPSFLCCL